jgi:hypothetical protein
MNYRPFKTQGLEVPPATVATTATLSDAFRGDRLETVAELASVAGGTLRIRLLPARPNWRWVLAVLSATPPRAF